MYRLSVLYPEPADRAAFEAYYRDTHLPLAIGLPGLLAHRVSFAVSSAGVEPAYFAVFEGDFADAAAFSAAMGSEHGQKVLADVPNYATGGAVMVHFEVEGG